MVTRQFFILRPSFTEMQARHIDVIGGSAKQALRAALRVGRAELGRNCINQPMTQARTNKPNFTIEIDAKYHDGIASIVPALSGPKAFVPRLKGKRSVLDAMHEQYVADKALPDAGSEPSKPKTLTCYKCNQTILDAEYTDYGDGTFSHVNACPPEPCENCSHQQCAKIRRDRKRAKALREPRLIELLTQMTLHLLETHMDEFSDNHGGDANHGGEAPEACSYCRTVKEVREFLTEIGADVRALQPQEFE